MLRNLSYNKNSLFLAVYIGILLNIPVYLQRYEFNSLQHVGIATLEALTVVATTFWILKLFSYLGATCYKILSALVLMISAVASYYMLFFKIVIGYGVVASVFTPEFSLYGEIIGYHLLGWSLLISAFPLRLILRSPFKTPSLGWVKNISLFFLPVISTWSFLSLSGYYQKLNEKLTNIDLPSYGGVWANSYLPINWVSALGLFSYTKFEERNIEESLINPVDKFTYLASKNVDEIYIVLIVGESAHWDRMGFFGYSRQITPYLSNEKTSLG